MNDEDIIRSSLRAGDNVRSTQIWRQKSLRTARDIDSWSNRLTAVTTLDVSIRNNIHL